MEYEYVAVVHDGGVEARERGAAAEVAHGDGVARGGAAVVVAHGGVAHGEVAHGDVEGRDGGVGAYSLNIVKAFFCYSLGGKTLSLINVLGAHIYL